MTKPTQFSQTLRAWMDAFMHRSMSGWNHFAKSTGLSMPQFSILMQLHHKGSCGMSEISDRFDITAPAASQLVDKLVHAGYLERAEDPSDRRAKLLTLSTRGGELIKQGIEERYRWMDDLATTLSVDDQKKVGEALILLTNAAREMESK
ncbi:MAG TPA: MarR family transcriptional regulator [Anaerolineales bacterium]|nr:MarR family transcriptional regulator [Anaerolineales bacterium]